MGNLIGNIVSSEINQEVDIVFEVQCPHCNEIIKVGLIGQWWGSGCRCGRQWGVFAVGMTEDE